MPVKPATLAWLRHSSRLTSSESSARSSFHQAMGAIPSLASIGLNSDALLGADFLLLLTRDPDRLARRDFRHADIPIRVTRNPGVSVGVDRQHGRSIGGLGPVEGSLQIGEAFAMPRRGPHGFGVLREIDVQRIGAILDGAVG